MGSALGRAWLAAGHPLTVWNRSRERAASLAAAGARLAATPAEAVAAGGLVVGCVLDDAALEETLEGADLGGRDLVSLVTGTPGQARARARWARSRGARFLDGGIMAVPPMIGRPDGGGYVFYSGSAGLFEEHRATLAVPADTAYVGGDPGAAALYDVALLSAMYGMFAGVAHAFALAGEEIAPTDLAPRLAAWLGAMTASVHGTARRLESGDFTTGVVSPLAMQVAGSATLLRTAEERGVSPELLTPYLDLLRRRLAEGHGLEDTTGAIGLLATGRAPAEA
ncbi:NAD(P)-dependent oxidoreductase [Streptomyces hoynatensis]|uniref:NAD(P)-dependent oxidoreductase n=2 Tax=Streptomyces hoynatensis TaxID=1141874 RepID=A0A3A9ZJE4_9ACTN|nr:NAD(P)-binding domain-containing protein [Streptomyces hoynatensis]RKN47316.1 NAD(P)-dependent oxidoreductase [Streptomyces hoynatensis]